MIQFASVQIDQYNIGTIIYPRELKVIHAHDGMDNGYQALMIDICYDADKEFVPWMIQAITKFSNSGDLHELFLPEHCVGNALVDKTEYYGGNRYFVFMKRIEE